MQVNIIGGEWGKARVAPTHQRGEGAWQVATATEENHEISVCILHLTACRCQDNYVSVSLSLCGYVWIWKLKYVCVLGSVPVCVNLWWCTSTSLPVCALCWCRWVYWSDMWKCFYQWQT